MDHHSGNKHHGQHHGEQHQSPHGDRQSPPKVEYDGYTQRGRQSPPRNDYYGSTHGERRSPPKDEYYGAPRGGDQYVPPHEGTEITMEDFIIPKTLYSPVWTIPRICHTSFGFYLFYSTLLLISLNIYMLTLAKLDPMFMPQTYSN